MDLLLLLGARASICSSLTLYYNNLLPNTIISFSISIMNMNPTTNSFINLYILSISTLLASTISTLTYYDSIMNAVGTNILPASTVAPPFQAPQNHPPLCVLPPPSAALPPPARLPAPPTQPAAGAKPEHAAWCVAKPTVAASVMQPALDYACAFGADCGPIQVGGACFQPDTVVAHSSFAFNSYWQKTKSGGGTCDFGGSALIVAVDPSYDQCHFPFT